MPANGTYLKVDGAPLEALQEALDCVESVQGELVLDFAAVHRIEPDAVRALETLAVRAYLKGVRVVLGAVPVAVYKVLKLVQLVPRFHFRA
jgi:anti-anti-sigma regulatory factor